MPTLDTIVDGAPKRAGWLRKLTLVSASLVPAVMLSPAAAYAASTDPTTTTTSQLTPVNNNPGLNQIGGSVTVFMTIVVGVLVLLLFAPVVYGALLAGTVPAKEATVRGGPARPEVRRTAVA